MEIVGKIKTNAMWRESSHDIDPDAYLCVGWLCQISRAIYLCKNSWKGGNLKLLI